MAEDPNGLVKYEITIPIEAAILQYDPTSPNTAVNTMSSFIYATRARLMGLILECLTFQNNDKIGDIHRFEKNSNIMHIKCPSKLKWYYIIDFDRVTISHSYQIRPKRKLCLL